MHPSSGNGRFLHASQIRVEPHWVTARQHAVEEHGRTMRSLALLLFILQW